MTKLLPPTPVTDRTAGSTVVGALQDKGTHLTRRIELTTGRDKTVTVLCLPPPDPCGGVVRHAYVVGSATALAGGGRSRRTSSRCDWTT